MADYRYFSTVGDLMDILKDIPRDIKIVSRETSMEKIGFTEGACINVEPCKFKKERFDTYDSFDGTPYSYDAIVRDDDGDIVAIKI